MADGDAAGQALDHLAAGEGVADEAEPALGVEPAAVEGDDAGGLLAAMLQGVQSERGDGGGVGMAEDAEHAAFLAQRVAFQIVLQLDRQIRSGFRSSWWAGSEGFLHRVHRASLLARNQRPTDFSICFFKPSRAVLAVAIAGAGAAGSASVCSSSAVSSS